MVGSHQQLADAPQSMGAVQEVHNSVAEAGLAVLGPDWLLGVAEATWVSDTCAIPVGLSQHNTVSDHQP